MKEKAPLLIWKVFLFETGITESQWNVGRSSPWEVTYSTCLLKKHSSINVNDANTAEMKYFDWAASDGFLLSILNLQHFLRLHIFLEGKMLQFPKIDFVSENGMHLDLADQDTLGCSVYNVIPAHQKSWAATSQCAGRMVPPSDTNSTGWDRQQ